MHEIDDQLVLRDELATAVEPWVRLHDRSHVDAATDWLPVDVIPVDHDRSHGSSVAPLPGVVALLELIGIVHNQTAAQCSMVLERQPVEDGGDRCPKCLDVRGFHVEPIVGLRAIYRHLRDWSNE